MRTVQLSPAEIAVVDRQDASSGQDGGWQALLVRLQGKIDRTTGILVLGARDLEQIPRYAFDYGNGGVGGALRRIFHVALGAQPGRPRIAFLGRFCFLAPLV